MVRLTPTNLSRLHSIPSSQLSGRFGRTSRILPRKSMNPNDKTTPEKDSRLFTILRADLREVDFKRTMRQELAELKEVMLTEERRQRLTKMSRLKRGFAIGWWLLKSLIRKLTPARRLLFVLGLVLIIVRFGSEKTNYDFS